MASWFQPPRVLWTFKARSPAGTAPGAPAPAAPAAAAAVQPKRQAPLSTTSRCEFCTLAHVPAIMSIEPLTTQLKISAWEASAAQRAFYSLRYCIDSFLILDFWQLRGLSGRLVDCLWLIQPQDATFPGNTSFVVSNNSWFSPRIPGFEEHIFQTGWLNHQLDLEKTATTQLSEAHKLVSREMWESRMQVNCSQFHSSHLHPAHSRAFPKPLQLKSSILFEMRGLSALVHACKSLVCRWDVFFHPLPVNI